MLPPMPHINREDECRAAMACGNSAERRGKTAAAPAPLKRCRRMLVWLQWDLQVRETHAAPQVVVDLLDDGGATNPGGSCFEEARFDERRQVLESGGRCAIAHRLEQIVFELDRILHRRQRGHRLQVKRVVLSEAR